MISLGGLTKALKSPMDISMHLPSVCDSTYNFSFSTLLTTKYKTLSDYNGKTYEATYWLEREHQLLLICI